MYLYLHPYLPQLLSTYLMSGQVGGTYMCDSGASAAKKQHV